MSTVIVVDDDEGTRSVLHAILTSKGDYRVLQAQTSDEGIRLCHTEPVGLLVADVVLGPASGTEVALTVVRSSPQMPVLFISGTPIEGWSERDFSNLTKLLPGRISFLGKPFTAQSLMQVVSRLISEGLKVGAEFEADVSSARAFRAISAYRGMSQR